MAGILTAAHEEWAKIPLEMFWNSFKSWPARVLAIHMAQSHHAPNDWNKKLKTEFLVIFQSPAKINESTWSKMSTFLSLAKVKKWHCTAYCIVRIKHLHWNEKPMKKEFFILEWSVKQFKVCFTMTAFRFRV
jgi:hypothetical protein